jgi:hypothetical protein
MDRTRGVEKSSKRRLPGYALAALGAVVLVCALPTTATAAGSIARREPSILSASWGTDNAVGCPTGEQGLDNIPVTFNWFILRSSIQTTDFQVVRSDGSSATPTCALQFPPDESDEGQTVNLIGDFGDSVNGPIPVAIRVVGALQGTAPGTIRWRQIAPLQEANVEPLPKGPNIVDAWTLTPAIYHGDANPCTVGKTFVRVTWSNGVTAYPTGAEVGAPVVASYRATYKLRTGRVVAVAPLDVADLHDHATSANADNMHDLCLPRLPRGATLTSVRIGGGLIQDPNGDANVAQKFRALAVVVPMSLTSTQAAVKSSPGTFSIVGTWTGHRERIASTDGTATGAGRQRSR